MNPLLPLLLSPFDPSAFDALRRQLDRRGPSSSGPAPLCARPSCADPDANPFAFIQRMTRDANDAAHEDRALSHGASRHLMQQTRAAHRTLSQCERRPSQSDPCRHNARAYPCLPRMTRRPDVSALTMPPMWWARLHPTKTTPTEP